MQYVALCFAAICGGHSSSHPLPPPFSSVTFENERNTDFETVGGREPFLIQYKAGCDETGLLSAVEVQVSHPALPPAWKGVEKVGEGGGGIDPRMSMTMWYRCK